MSYLSKVGIAVKKDDYQKMIKELNDNGYDSNCVLYWATILERDNVCVIIFDEIKWYVGEYEDISIIDDFVNKLEWCEYFEIGEDLCSTPLIKGHDKFEYLPLKTVTVPKGW